jgi:2-methylisocitrate lyase-like PEP mutase family enzyme
MQLEDQVMPKKCGHMLGRQIVSLDEMAGKIKAAVDTRSDPDEMLIMARTDARTDHGMEETLKRGHAYEKAGADILFMESLESEEEMRTVTSAFGVPVLANMLEHGRTPLMSASQLEEIGYDLVIYCVSSTYVVAKAVWDLMKCLKDTGTTAGMLREMITFEAFNKLVGLPEIRRIEREYHSGRDLTVEDGK